MVHNCNNETPCLTLHPLYLHFARAKEVRYLYNNSVVLQKHHKNSEK